MHQNLYHGVDFSKIRQAGSDADSLMANTYCISTLCLWCASVAKDLSIREIHEIKMIFFHHQN